MMPLNLLLRAISFMAAVGQLPSDGRARGERQLSRIGAGLVCPGRGTRDLSKVPSSVIGPGG